MIEDVGRDVGLNDAGLYGVVDRAHGNGRLVVRKPGCRVEEWCSSTPERTCAIAAE